MNQNGGSQDMPHIGQAAPVLELIIRHKPDGSVDIVGPPQVLGNPPQFFWMLKTAEIYMLDKVLGHSSVEGGQVLVVPPGALMPPDLRG